MDPYTAVIIATELKELYAASKAKHDTEFLPSGPLKLFTKFKTAYDGQDTKALSRCIAPGFQGDFYDADTKAGLIEVFDGLFNQMPSLASPHLTITLHQVIKNTATAYEAIVSFNTKLTVAGFEIPFTDYDAGEAVCRVETCGARNSWQITKLNHNDE